MKRIGFILLLFTSSVGFAQKYAVKTNLAYWATTTLNADRRDTLPLTCRRALSA